MDIKQLKIRRFLALRILAAFLLTSTVPQANARVLDRFLGSGFEISGVDQINGHSTLYLAANDPKFSSQESQEWFGLNSTVIEGNFLLANGAPIASPVNIPHQVIGEVVVPTTAYSSTPDQTDASPFTTASGTRVRDGIVAANFLPFGTKIKIPEVFGGKIFVVEDRMNKRYWHKVDVWFPDRQSALDFGLKILKIQILES